MAPMSPDSLKRSGSSLSGDDIDEPPNKKIRVEHTPQTPKTVPSPILPYIHALPQTPPPEREDTPPPEQQESFDAAPTQLMMRSIALTLKHVGFDGAKPEAMEALVSRVESYAAGFLSQITTAMTNARRHEPLPSDFEYALYKYDLPLSSLSPHLDVPIPASKTKVQLELVSTESQEAEKEIERKLATLLGSELNGEIETREKLYIPKNFKPFPALHTYKSTEPDPVNQRDRRQLREENSIGSKQAEGALRRLINATKTGKKDDLEKIACRNPETKKTHEHWKDVITSLSLTHPQASDEHNDEEQSMIVNSGAKYFRKGVSKKNTVLPAEIRLEF